MSAAEEAMACPSLKENFQRGPLNSDSDMKEKTLVASDGMVGHKAINDDADKNSKHYSLESPTQPSSPLFGQMSIAAAEREMIGSRGVESTLDAAEGRPDVQLSPIKQGKQIKNNKKIKNNKNRVTGGKNMGLPTLVENDGTLRAKIDARGYRRKFKKYFY